jgi:Tfp pilus assembly protein PilX
MVRPRTNKTDTSERGMALLVALLALLLVSAISLGLIVMSNSESSISSNFRDEQVAFFGARGGVEEVLDRLRTSAPLSDCLGEHYDSRSCAYPSTRRSTAEAAAYSQASRT